MKKIVVALLTLVLLCTLAAPAFAADAKNAFENIVLNANEDEFEYIQNKDGRIRGATAICYVEGYGVGRGTEGDMVLIKNVDFGANGAKEMTLPFSYKGEGDSLSTLSVHIDSPDAAPVANFAISDTGGWDSTYAKEFTQPVTIPGGVHDVYVEFTNAESGSFAYVRFAEADAPVAAAAPAASAPATADMGVIAGIAAIMTASAGFVALKKR